MNSAKETMKRFVLCIVLQAVLCFIVKEHFKFLNHNIIIWLSLIVSSVSYAYFYSAFDKDNYVSIYSKRYSKRN